MNLLVVDIAGHVGIGALDVDPESWKLDLLIVELEQEKPSVTQIIRCFVAIVLHCYDV